MPLSFRLHAELAAEHDGATRWGYRRLGVGQISCKGRPLPTGTTAESADARKADSVSLGKRGAADADDRTTADATKHARARHAAGLPTDLDWIAPSVARAYSTMGSNANTGQVHPLHFTTAMAALAQEKGARVITDAAVTAITSSAEGSRDDDATMAVTYTNAATGTPETISANDVVICAGPWSQRVYAPAPISALRAHSVTIRPTRTLSPYALFTEIAVPASAGRKAQRVSPEIYARPNDEVYACGEGDRVVPLPETSADVETDPQRCQDIIDHVGAISDELRDGEVTARQACYLPSNDVGSGFPLVGPTGEKGVWLAAGHTCWGIQNGPGTGKVMSEWIMDGKVTSAKVAGLDPRKFL